MSPDSLQSLSRKALEDLARKRGVARAAALTRPQLLLALRKGQKETTQPPSRKAGGGVKRGAKRVSAGPGKTPASKPRGPATGTRVPRAKANGVAPAAAGGHRRLNGKTTPAVVKQPAEPVRSRSAPELQPSPAPASLAVPRRRDLSTSDSRGKNFLSASACDSHWIRVTWMLSRDSVRRAETRLGTEWHRAVPVLRLFRIHSDDASAGNETFARDVVIDSDSNTWYLPVPMPGKSFRVHVGYRGSNGTFFAMAKSNVCHMPRMKNARLSEAAPVGGLSEHGEMIDGAGAGDDANPARPLGFSAIAHFGPAATRERLTGEFSFKLGTELVIYGNTRPGSALTVQGEPVELRDDGSFTLRINQPEGRQVLAFTAMDPRGNERRMIVLAIERNTKELERQYFDGGHAEMTGE